MKRDMKKWLDGLRSNGPKKPLPILSFPAVQLMGVTVRELISNAELQAEGMRLIAERTDSAAAVSLMDLSVEAECFGSQIVISENEVPTVKGSVIASEEDAEEMAMPAIGTGRTGIYIDAIRRASAKITDRPVFAGMIGPYSLASRLMDVTEIMYLLSDSPITRKLDSMPGKLGAAIDIGTTTLAVSLFDLSVGRQLGTLGAENPQRAFSADVMGRISAAITGKSDQLKECILSALGSMLSSLLASLSRMEEWVDSLVITGNTTMLHLLTGQDVRPLSHAPFLAEQLYGEELKLLNANTYLPPCISAFVGADITCAVLHSHISKSDRPVMLCDIGTNGEIALWKDGILYVTSTAAGPAFEGAGISCSCSSVSGAIDRMWVENGKIKYHTIGDAAPVGLCGSGLLDALAVCLEQNKIDEMGAMSVPALEIAPGIALTRADVRSAQLAKAAVAAGVETLLRYSNVKPDEVSEFLIAGGFGGHINVSSAVRIGLVPRALASRVRFLGNAALGGAERLLLDCGSRVEVEQIGKRAQWFDLGGDRKFNDSFVDHLYFEET